VQLSNYLYGVTVKPYLEAHDHRISHALTVTGRTALHWARSSIQSVASLASELSRNLPAVRHCADAAAFAHIPPA